MFSKFPLLPPPHQISLISAAFTHSSIQPRLCSLISLRLAKLFVHWICFCRLLVTTKQLTQTVVAVDDSFSPQSYRSVNVSEHHSIKPNLNFCFTDSIQLLAKSNVNSASKSLDAVENRQETVPHTHLESTHVLLTGQFQRSDLWITALGFLNIGSEPLIVIACAILNAELCFLIRCRRAKFGL